MTKRDKLIQKIKSGKNISYDEVESLLFYLGFELRVSGSHHIFYKKNCKKNISIKKRTELLPYQMKMVEEIINEHEEKERLNLLP